MFWRVLASFDGFNSAKLWLCYTRQKQLTAEHASYAAHNPDLRALLSDFIQHLLIDKPADVLDFCAQYFGAFSADYTTIEIAHSSVVPDSGLANDVERQVWSKTWHDSPYGSDVQHTTFSVGSIAKSNDDLQ